MPSGKLGSSCVCGGELFVHREDKRLVLVCHSCNARRPARDYSTPHPLLGQPLGDADCEGWCVLRKVSLALKRG